MKKKAAYLIIFILLVPLTSFGQNPVNNVSTVNSSKTQVELERDILLENDSNTEVVIFEVKQNTKLLEFQIQSTVKNGKVTIEVFDPKGTRQGNFTVETLINSKKEEVVNGNIRKSLVEPPSGKWKVKIIPNDARGRIQIITVTTE